MKYVVAIIFSSLIYIPTGFSKSEIIPHPTRSELDRRGFQNSVLTKYCGDVNRQTRICTATGMVYDPRSPYLGSRTPIDYLVLYKNNEKPTVWRAEVLEEVRNSSTSSITYSATDRKLVLTVIHDRSSGKRMGKVKGIRETFPMYLSEIGESKGY